MRKITILSVLLLSVKLMALDSAQQLGLVQAQDLLKSEQQRAELIKVDNKARNADGIATITSLGNKDTKNEIYNVSSDLLDWIAKSADGPNGAAEKIKNYQSDPQAFLRDMPAEQLAKVKAIAESIENQRNARSPASTRTTAP